MFNRNGQPGSAETYLGGAVGAGIVLVLFPSLTLVFRMEDFHRNPTFGYPILAIFGIMMLLGALALVSTLFARLKLSAPSEALALPSGSIRATVALSLIVLFALLAVMLYQSLCGAEPVVVKGISEAAKQKLVADPANRDARVTPVPCPSPHGTGPTGTGAAAASGAAVEASGAAPSDPCDAGALFKYDVQIGHAASGPAVDFAKQLLTLIGTLMTSVVSFYFAAKSTETAAAKVAAELTGGTTPPKAAAGADASGTEDADHEHGGVSSPTADADLPPAQGGVAEPK